MKLNAHITHRGGCTLTIEEKDFARAGVVARALKEVQQAKDLFKGNPELVVRTWVTAAQLKEGERRKAIGDLLKIVSELPIEVVTEVCRNLPAERYGGRWPAVFLDYGDAAAACMMVVASTRIADVEVAGEALRLLLRLPPSTWTSVVSAAKGGSEGALRVLKDFIETLTLTGVLLVPQADRPGILTAVVGGYAETVVSAVEVKVDVFDDPKRRIGLKAVDWPVENEAIRLALIQVVNAVVLGGYMPKQLHDLCARAAREEQQIRARIQGHWDELRRAARSEEGTQSIRHWVAGDGLTKLSFDLGGFTTAQTGVWPATFYGGGHPFPHLDVEFEFCVLSRLIPERAYLGHGGMLGNVEKYEEGSLQRGLRLLLNLAVVRQLCELAFKPSKQSSGSNGNGEGKNGTRRATLPTFRRIHHLLRKNGEPWQPSDEALARVPANAIVPPGHTYVASPPLHSRAAHPDIKPLVLEVSVGENDL